MFLILMVTFFIRRSPLYNSHFTFERFMHVLLYCCTCCTIWHWGPEILSLQCIQTQCWTTDCSACNKSFVDHICVCIHLYHMWLYVWCSCCLLKCKRRELLLSAIFVSLNYLLEAKFHARKFMYWIIIIVSVIAKSIGYYLYAWRWHCMATVPNLEVWETCIDESLVVSM